MMLRGPTLRTRLFFRPTSLSRAVSSLAPPLIRIQDGTFYQNYPTQDDAANKQNPPLFPNLSFVLQSEQAAPTETSEKIKDEPHQHWAVIGTKGRTELLDILRGQYICVPPTARSYPYLLTDKLAKKDPRLRFVGNAIQYIGFSGEGSEATGGTRGAYLSARYESHREETDWTVLQYLKGQTSLNPLEGEEGGKIKNEELLNQVISDLRLGELLDMPVANLSNGQTRRARVAKALLRKPELLLLDDPFMGLDPATVRSISGLFQRLADKSDPRLILALRPQDTVPDWITHIVVLGNSNKILFQGPRAEAQKVFDVWVHTVLGRDDSQLNEEQMVICRNAKSAMEAGQLDRQLLWDLRLLSTRTRDVALSARKGGEPLIEMEGVRVKYGEKTVLGGWKQKVNNEEKEGLHWTVRRGQRWVILGANGSGKTTLLSLITSDHPQAYALPMKLFGRSRLPEAGSPGISIFELQSRIGHSSPEIHAFFPRQLTIRQAVESAFAETFLSKPKLNHDRDLDVSAVLRFFKAELDPNAAVTMNEQRPLLGADIRKHFPKIAHAKGPKPAFYPLDYDVEYADITHFSALSTAQQRLVLFIRAIVSKPDIVILDEAFSGMSASMRDKCIHFLEAGEFSRNRPSTVMRRSTNKETWLKGFNPDETAMRHTGLSDDQALIMISHNREEIPDSVRFYMRLPSEDVDGSEPLDFRFGIVKYTSTLNDPEVWEKAWLPPSEFQSRFVKSWRGKPDESPEAAADEDDRIYEWYTLG
ncbi:putative ABC transporter [Aspergillus alliaceus]|uniref:putative ABC transporter n=1 Tax=Petromyces alliaceus TaxID=209559 RepID=UPI0012A4180F|nr:P-loop containing nucleoside triphosphate hydrolase protein [Aspergillus alliaceus]KAB8232405.1 P-loop containing nucleoside triphosphate hydrolase protein [Aspergillus alliaceus]